MIKNIIIGVFVCLILQHVIKVIYYMGFNTTVYNHQPGSCHFIEGVDNGSEDMQTLPEGLTFITSGMQLFEPKEHIKGQIFLFDFSNPRKNAVSLELKGNIDKNSFNPHGLSIYENSTTGQIILFVVNHHPLEDRVEKFQFNRAELSLTHLKSYTNPLFTKLNDVLAISDDSFYTTVFWRFAHPFLNKLETYLSISLHSIIYVDGDKALTVVPSLFLANGINQSPDGKYVYVADSSYNSGGFTVYLRKPDMSLEFKERVSISTSLDNLEVLPNGNILTGCHPRVFDMAMFIQNQRLSAPSQVLLIKMNNGQMTAVDEVYSNDENGMLYGASIATHFKGRMLIGTVTHKLLYCDVDIQPLKIDLGHK